MMGGGERRAGTDGRVAHGIAPFLAGGGELGRLIARLDWASTPLGPIERWRQSLRSAAGICLASRFPIVVYWGSELTVLYNDAYSEILGAKHPWALGKPCAVCWEEIWDTIGPMLEGVVKTGEATWSDDLELDLERHGAAEECYFSFSFSPVRVEDGSVGGIFTAVVETTNRVLSERRLRVLSKLGERVAGARSVEESMQRCAEAVFERRTVPFALFYTDGGDGGAALAARAGIDPASEACSPQCWPLAEVARAGRPATVPVEAGVARPDGEWALGLAPRSAIVAPVAAGEPGRPAGYLVTATNPLRPLDADYRAFFDLAARQVTAAVVHAQAYEAERRRAEALAELDRAKTEFFSNVSHEFRTPLTLMLGPLESLLDEARVGSHQAVELDMVRRNALRLLKLVNTLLDFARIQSVRGEAVFEPVELATYTAELAAVFRAAVEKAGLRLVVECEPLAEAVHVDRAMWEKIVLNLLSNALKFTFQGEIRVAVTDAGGMAAVTIADTGTGIADEDLPHIFERFYRSSESGARTHEGAGIGLALVRELVEMMGGTIVVASKPLEGTRFTVTLPHRPIAGTAIVASAAGRRIPSVSLANTTYAAEAVGWVGVDRSHRTGELAATAAAREGRLLLVDDNADMRAYLADVLGDRWEVEAVADGVEALAAVRARRPDLVLTDVMMPRMDGFELLGALRADAELRDVPVVVLSARAGEDSVEGLVQGADDYVVKPFTLQELRARLSANLGLAKMRSALARARAELGLADERAWFLNMAAHELRTPLTVIGGYLDLLVSGVVDPKSEAGRIALETAAQKTREGVRLVEQMLAAARMESGALSVNSSPGDLRQLAREAAERAHALAELQGTELRTVVPDLPVVADLDPGLVGLILDNLVGNALSHGAGPVRVEVEGAPPRVRVVDSGSGVARGARGRIFEPFFRVDGAAQPGGGAGLGLAVSRRLAELHGGSLVLEETSGGASFVLSLPEPESAAAPPDAARAGID
jgi:signal transduction histidine kinase